MHVDTKDADFGGGSGGFGGSRSRGGRSRSGDDFGRGRDRESSRRDRGFGRADREFGGKRERGSGKDYSRERNSERGRSKGSRPNVHTQTQRSGSAGLYKKKSGKAERF